MSTKRIVVTGPTGQVGLHLIDALQGSGHAVRALVLEGDRALEGRSVETVVGDVRDPASLEAVLTDADVVYHLAAVVSTSDNPGPQLWEVNVEGARNVAAVARRCGVRRLVHFSSIVVFDPAPYGAPLDETRPRIDTQGSPYGRSKVQGEDAILAEVAEGLDAVIVMPTVVVGPYENHHQGIVRNLIAKQRNRSLPALLRGGFNAVDVLDVVDGAMRAADRGRTGERYILGGHWHSVAGFCRVAEAVGVGPAPRVQIPLSWVRASLPAVNWVADRLGMDRPLHPEEIRQLCGNPNIRWDKAARELGYAPRPIGDALRRCAAWLDDEAQAASA